MTKARPFLVRGLDAEGEKLSLLPAQHKTFNEEWLQQLLYKHPTILPVDEMDESFSPPISIGREIANIDNLFISPEGLLTVVLLGLWRLTRRFCPHSLRRLRHGKAARVLL